MIITGAIFTSSRTGCDINYSDSSVNVPAERREVTPMEMNTSTEVSLTNRISIRNSLASASIVDEQGSPLLSSILWRLLDEVGIVH
ncbi:MAG: hypothetical protein ACFFBD_29595 [Candidatus Hodarchaeota archaeon]